MATIFLNNFSWLLILFGVVGICLGWKLLVRYRKAFVVEPERTMSTEVFAYVIGLGGYGYFAVLSLLVGTACVLVGAWALIEELLSRLRWI
jgi:hypothetical protein